MDYGYQPEETVIITPSRRYAIKNKEMLSIGLRVSQDNLAKHTLLKLSAEPYRILPGVWTTGEITERMEFEGRSSHHYIKADEGWQPDPYWDDMALVLEAKPGLIVICGYCHSGLLNTLMHVHRIFNQKIAAIVGGTHLANVDADTLKHTINILRATSTGCWSYLYLKHCKGNSVLVALSQAFGKNAHQYPAGTVLMFN